MMSDLLALLPAIAKGDGLDVSRLQAHIETTLHPEVTPQWVPSRRYSHRIIHVHGPSASGRQSGDSGTRHLFMI